MTQSGGNMPAWIFDASWYRDEWAHATVPSPEGDSFIEPQSTKLLVVAPKGMGKTFILQDKSRAIRQAQAGALFIPPHTLLEKFENLAHSFDEGGYQQFNNSESWKVIWSTAISTLILYKASSETPVEFFEFGNLLGLNFERPLQLRGGTIESLILRMLKMRYSQYCDIYATVLKPLLTEIKQEVFVFVDSADQAVDKHAHASSATEGELGQTGWISNHIWAGAQLGLMAAQRDIHYANTRIRVYGGIRTEAINSESILFKGDSLRLQNKEIYFNLKYDKAMTERIFIENIRITERRKLVQYNATDPYIRFLGFKELKHSKFLDSKGVPISEPVFDFIYRHTFGRPREVVYIGQQLNNISASDRNEKTVKEVIYEAARFLYGQYKETEIFPAWNEKYDVLLRYIKSNVLPERTVFAIFDKLRRSNPELKDPFSYFVNRGLIGYVVRNADDTADSIEFRPAGEFSADAFQLQQSTYYFIHPCLTALINLKNNKFFVNHSQLVGPGNNLTLKREPDVLRISVIRKSRFRFTYNDDDMSGLNEMGGLAMILPAALLCAIHSTGLREIPVEAVAEIAGMLVQAELIDVDHGGAIGLSQEILERFPANNADLSVRNLSLIKMIDHALGDLPPATLASGDAADASDYCVTGGARLSFGNGVFLWAFCHPSKVDATDLLNMLEAVREKLE
jgi:hypothetical protein